MAGSYGVYVVTGAYIEKFYEDKEVRRVSLILPLWRMTPDKAFADLNPGVLLDCV